MAEPSEHTCSAPSTPPRHTRVIHPSSPAEAYRLMRLSGGERGGAHGRESPARQDGLVPEADSPVRSPPTKAQKRGLASDLPSCSMCGNSCVHARSIGLGARVTFALVAQGFRNGLAGKLVACETCGKALTRAKGLFTVLSGSVLAYPPLDRAGPALRIANLRQGVNLIAREFTQDPSAIEARPRVLAPSHGWDVLPALGGIPDCGEMLLLKSPDDNRFGPILLCDSPFDRDTGLIKIMDIIDRRPFKVPPYRLAPKPEPGVSCGIATAPRAAHAATMRLKERLHAAEEEASGLQAKTSDLEIKLLESRREFRHELQVSAASIDGLSGQLIVARDRAAHAYKQGMHDYESLQRQVQSRDDRIAELLSEVGKVMATFYSRTKKSVYNSYVPFAPLASGINCGP